MSDLPKSPANHKPLSPIGFLERAATVFGERTSIIYGSRRHTWCETLDRCRRLASVLASLNIGHGDVVSVLAPNIPAMYEMHFGVPMAGAVLNTLNIRLDARTLSYLLRHSEAKAVFVDHEFLPLIQDALRLLSSEIFSQLPSLVVIRDNLDQNASSCIFDQGELDYEKLLKDGNPTFQICWPSDEWQTISLNYTSGTTSIPKGVCFHHRGAYLTALVSILTWGMKECPVYLWTVPMFHCNGWCFTWAVAAQGGTNVCIRHVTAEVVYDAIAEHNVTHLCGAPVVLNILASASGHEIRPLSSKVHVITGGAPPPPSILMQIRELGFDVTHSYGLTESYGPALFCRWKLQWNSLSLEEQAELKARQGVSHLGLDMVDVKNPETMSSVPHDGKTIGEVMMRGSTIMKGYLKDAKATQNVFEGGWLHTGDLGVMHPDGYIQLKDRSKDMIISGGENISSIELESILHSHPEILEAAVVARPDEFWGETPCAFVRLKNYTYSEPVSAESIIAFCRARLPHYMIPRTVIFGDLPRTATGKIQKYILRERAKNLANPQKGKLSRL
eukprot:c25186_g1_i1 orf=114-1790(+)